MPKYQAMKVDRESVTNVPSILNISTQWTIYLFPPTPLPYGLYYDTVSVLAYRVSNVWINSEKTLK